MLLDRFGIAAGLFVLLVASATIGVGSAELPPVDDERNGLTQAELASLFSRDRESKKISLARARDNNAVQELANATDITFKRPVSTAATWSSHDVRNFDHGGTGTSIHPPGANLVSGRFLRDGYAAVFAIHPSTRLHKTSHRAPLYVAPDGTLLSTIDYRIRVPASRTTRSRQVSWSIQSHGIKRVRLKAGGEVLDSMAGTHTPQLEYSDLGSGNWTLTVEAVISVTMKKKIKKRHFRSDDEECERDQDNSDDGEDDDDDGEVDEGGECFYWTTHYRSPSESIAVNESVDVTIYRLDPEVRYARFPDGSVEVLVSADRPWAGVTVGGVNVTGVWRFYTARDTRWDTLIASSASEDRRITSDVVPVYVHAYPSQTGVQVRPVRGPDLLNASGRRTSSPQATLGDNISVDVVRQPYRRSQRVLIRVPEFDRETIRVAGVVRGETASPTGSAVRSRPVRRGNLTVEVLRSDERQATLRIRLRDNQTGRPIILQDEEKSQGEPRRDGYITVDGRRVGTNSSGVALVTVDEPGIYTARYHPESWLRVTPAYTDDTATARWHPLATLEGWISLLVQVIRLSIPFVVTYYAGTRLLAFIRRKNTL